VAAQIAAGVGFIGAGLIFVRRDSVHGLTTAATVWLTAAIGAAAGAGLVLAASAATVGHFLIVFAFTPVSHWLDRDRKAKVIRVVCERDSLPAVVDTAGDDDVTIAAGRDGTVEVTLTNSGGLASRLATITGVRSVSRS